MTPVKKPSTWVNLPRTFKLDLVKLLDVKSRGSFSKSSSNNQFHVNLVPLYLEFVRITPQPYIPNVPITFLFETNESSKIVGQEEAVLGLIEIFKHRKTTVETLEIGMLNEQETNRTLYRLTKNLLKSVAYKVRAGYHVAWNVENFIWHGPMRDIRFTELLGHLNPNSLTSMFLSIKTDIPGNVMHDIIRTRQWRNLKHLRVSGRIHEDLDIFDHLEKIEVDVHHMHPEMLAAFILKFHSRNLPHECYFAFHCPYFLDQEFETITFDLVNAEHPEPIMVEAVDRLGQEYGKLNMPDTTNKFLVLMKGSRLAVGMVCEEDDCELEMCHQVIQVRFRSFGIVA